MRAPELLSLYTVYATDGTSANDMESDNTPKRPAFSTTQTPKKYKKQKKVLSAEARQAKRDSDRLRSQDENTDQHRQGF